MLTRLLLVIAVLVAPFHVRADVSPEYYQLLFDLNGRLKVLAGNAEPDAERRHPERDRLRADPAVMGCRKTRQGADSQSPSTASFARIGCMRANTDSMA